MSDMLLTIEASKYREALLWLQERGIEARKDRISVAQSLKWYSDDTVRPQQIDLSGLKMNQSERLLFKLTFGGK